MSKYEPTPIAHEREPTDPARIITPAVTDLDEFSDHLKDTPISSAEQTAFLQHIWTILNIIIDVGLSLEIETTESCGQLGDIVAARVAHEAKVSSDVLHSVPDQKEKWIVEGGAHANAH